MVKERSKPFLLFPGGKQEEGETIEQALHREIREELSATVVDVRGIGAVEGVTPDGRPLRMHLFTGGVETEPVASAEIVELRWLAPGDAEAVVDELTPITKEKVFPYLMASGVW